MSFIGLKSVKLHANMENICPKPMNDVMGLNFSNLFFF